MAVGRGSHKLEKLLKKGAEASLYRTEWFGDEVIRKARILKTFRQLNLDIKLRESRTRREALFLREAKRAGITTPLVYFVDLIKAEIIMQFIPGRSLKEIIESDDEDISLKWCTEVGRYVARLHKVDMIHGDLTTSNFVISHDKLVMMDFGLSFYSQRLEDRAIDIHLLNMVVQSAHNNYAENIMHAVLQGYQEIASKSNSLRLLERIKVVERRGRYKRVE